MEHILIESVEHIVVEKFLRDELEYFLVVLPILHLLFLDSIFSDIRLIFNEPNQCRNNFKDDKNHWETIKSCLSLRILAYIE